MNIGENQAPITPDLVSPQAKSQLFTKLSKAIIDKKGFDEIFGAIAKKYGGEFTSRVKNPETVVQKISLKRLQGRDYNLDDMTDLLGGRIIIQHRDFPKAIKDIEKVTSALGINVAKKEDASHGTYRGYHMDLQTQDGGKMELQLHDPQSSSESVVNHSLRSVYGENPPEPIKQLRDKQAQIVNNLPDDKAQAVGQAVQQIAQRTGGKPIDPRITANLLSSIQK